MNKKTMIHNTQNASGLSGITKYIVDHDIGVNKKPIDYLSFAPSYFKSIIAHMPCYVYWKDTHFNYLGCNNLTSKLLKLSSTKAIFGMTDYDFGWDKAKVDEFRSIDRKIIITGNPIFNLEETIPLSDGGHMDLLVNKMPLFDNDKNIIGLVGISVDITKRKHLTHTLLGSKEKIETALAPKEQVELESREKSTLLHSVLKEFKLDRYYLTNEYQGKYLTKREAECGYCLARGNTAKEIGNALHLSQRTVEGYLNSLREKLNARTRSDLISKLMACHFLDGVKPNFY